MGVRPQMAGAARITPFTGAALGGAVGGAVGASYGTYEAFAYKVCVVFFSLCFSPNNYFKALMMTKMMLCTVITTDEPLLLQIPGMLKVRHIGRTTLGSAGLFSLFLGAGSLLHCGRRN